MFMLCKLLFMSILLPGKENNENHYLIFKRKRPMLLLMCNGLV